MKNKSRKKIRYFSICVALGMLISLIPAVCYGANTNNSSTRLYWADDASPVIVMASSGLDTETAVATGSATASTTVASTDSAGSGTTATATATASASDSVNLFDPAVMSEVRTILENNQGAQLSSDSISALKKLGLSEQTVTGIVQMSAKYPGQTSGLTADELLQTSAGTSSKHYVVIVLIFILFMAIIGCLIYIITRKNPDSQ